MEYSKILDIFSILVLFIANILVFYNLYTFVTVDKIPVLTIESPLIFPFLVALTLLILLIAIVFTQIRFWKSFKIDKELHAEDMRDLRNTIFYFFLLLLYSYSLPKLHFKLSSFLFVLGTMFFFSRGELNGNILKKMLILAGFSFLLIYSIYFVFSGIFLVILP